MKAIMIVLVAVTALVIIGGVVYAHGPWGWWMGYEADTNIENLRKFQKETLSLRDELITKRLELQAEYSKPQRDYDRISTLRKEIVDIQTKIQAVADKYGIPDKGERHGMRHGMRGYGMMGYCPCPVSR